MKKEANLTSVMVVQQLETEYWHGWKEQFITEAKNGDIRPLLSEVVRRLEDGNCTVSEAYGIIHDKDEITVWDSEKMENVIEKKAKHVHLLLKFDKGSTIKNLAVKIGVEQQYLEKAKSGRYGYDNILSYLVHAKDQKKYQYKPQEVVTLRGEDYESLYNRRMETWVRGRATKEAADTNLSVDYLTSEILAGRITKSQVLLTDDYYKVYALHKRKINEAFETAGENKSYRTIADLENGKFKKTVIFISAESGAGKTVLGKKIISGIQPLALENTGYNWDSCLTASSNAFDEYNGQDVLFLDDLRGDSLHVSDWLKLLDPFSISPISARYHNKMGAAKIIIITSTKHPIPFFTKAKGNHGEDLGQFIRRIDLLVNITDVLNLFKTEKDKQFSEKDSTQNAEILSHGFLKWKDCDEETALNEIIKIIAANMQWNQEELKKEIVTPLPTAKK